MKTLIIAGNGSSGCRLVPKLVRRYPLERFEDCGSYFESASFIVTWAAESLFRISAASAVSLSRREMEDQIKNAEKDNKLCPDWKFEFIDALREKQFEALKSLVNSTEVGSIIHAGGYCSDEEVMIRIILHMAEVKKPAFRLVLKSDSYAEFVFAMSNELPSVFSFNRLAVEGFLNMLMNYWYGNTNSLQENNPVDQILNGEGDYLTKELRVLTGGYCCSRCKQCEICQDKGSVTMCAAFIPGEKFLRRLKILINKSGNEN